MLTGPKADVRLDKRLLGNGASGDVLGNLLVIRRNHCWSCPLLMPLQEPVGGEYDSIYPYSSSPVDAADLDAIAGLSDADGIYKRNGILPHSSNGNEADDAVDVSLCISPASQLLTFDCFQSVVQLVSHVKGRDLLGQNKNNLADNIVEADVDVRQNRVQPVHR